MTRQRQYILRTVSRVAIRLAIIALASIALPPNSHAQAQDRQRIELDWPLDPSAPLEHPVLARSKQALIVAVDSLDDVQIETTLPKSLEPPALPKIVYRAIYRGQPLVLIQFPPPAESSGNIHDFRRPSPIQLSWSARPATRLEARDNQGPPAARALGKLSNHPSPLPTPATRIPITEHGLFVVPIQQIKESLGATDETFDLNHLALLHKGAPVPFELIQGSESALPTGESILFRGEPTMTDYTKTNVFWLTQSPTSHFKMPTLDVTPSDEHATPASFPTTIHGEEDLHIWQTMSRGEGLDHWFWGDKLTAPGTRDYTLETPFPAPSDRETSIRVKYHGLTFSTRHRPDHQAQLFLNQTLIGDHFWDDRNPTLQSVQFPHMNLLSGTNTITIGAPGLPDIVVDQFFVNWIEIDYDRRYIASNNRIEFAPPSTGQFTFDIAGFNTNSLDVLDITQLRKTTRLQNFETLTSDEGTRVRLTAHATPDTRFLVQATTDRKPVPSLTLDTPSAWRRPDLGADYIVITHEEFTEQAKRLADYRQSRGLRTVVVQIQDVYDEFSHGQFDPQAIQDFLAYAYHHWIPPAPRFVVLFGDAYLDYHDNLKTGSINYVPSQQINTELIGLTISDNWFAQVDGDDKIPDLSIGRIPVRNADEGKRVVDRIIHYESTPTPGDWNTRIGLIADDDSEEFADLSNELASFVPPPISITKWYAGEIENPTSAGVIDVFQSGHSLITYTGHGTISSWGLTGNGSILLTSSLSASINPNGQWPIVTVANCLNGFFAARHSSACLAESLLASRHGGAIAVWAPTSLGFPTGHRILMNEFYKQVFHERQLTLGEATTAAQIATFVQDPVWLELMETYILFGDPALTINLDLPAKQPALSVHSTQGQTLEIRFSESPDTSYTLFSNTTLNAEASWTEVTEASREEGLFRVSIDPNLPQQFFKVEARNIPPPPPATDQ